MAESRGSVGDGEVLLVSDLIFQSCFEGGLGRVAMASMDRIAHGAMFLEAGGGLLLLSV